MAQRDVRIQLAIDLFEAKAERSEIGGRQWEARRRLGADGGVHGFFLRAFPCVATILCFNGMSMTAPPTYCVSRKVCHNVRHVGPNGLSQ